MKIKVKPEGREGVWIAAKWVYECWRDEAESNAEFSVIGEYTKELAEDYGLE